MPRCLIALVLVALLLAACQSNAPSNGGQPSSGASYTCPMHPNVVTAQPGQCPQCGMDLVKKN